MAARENQPQAGIVHGSVLRWFRRRLQRQRLRVTVVARRLAPQTIDRAVARGGDDPSGGTRWHTGVGPPIDRDRERVLNSLFRQVDIAEVPDEDRHRAAVLLAEDALDLQDAGVAHFGRQAKPLPETAALRSAAAAPPRACAPMRARRRDRGP